MRKPIPVMLILLLTFASTGVADEAGNHWHDVCECLTTEWPEVGKLEKRRVEVGGVSFEVPVEAKKCERVSIDSLTVSWDYWGFSLNYKSPHLGHGRIAQGSVDSFCAMDGFGGKIWAWGKDGHLILSFSDTVRESKVTHSITISAGDASSACKWGNIVVRTLEPVNQLSKLKVLHIDINRGYFVYENEVGERRIASIGDFIGRGGGEVIEIREESIDVEVMDMLGFMNAGLMISTDDTEVERKVVSIQLERKGRERKDQDIH